MIMVTSTLQLWLFYLDSVTSPRNLPRNLADTDKLGTRLSNQRHAYEHAMQNTEGVEND